MVPICSVPIPRSRTVVASQCGQEVLYLREILRDFFVLQVQPTCIYEDNLACIAMSENQVRRKYSRHIDIRRYFVALRTHLMFADALTKGLPGPAHIQHRSVMFGTTPCGPHDTFSTRLLHAEAALLLSFLSLLFCVLPNSCGFTPLLCKGESDYHLSHALIICDGFQFRPSLYCFTEFVNFRTRSVN